MTFPGTLYIRYRNIHYGMFFIEIMQLLELICLRKLVYFLIVFGSLWVAYREHLHEVICWIASHRALIIESRKVFGGLSRFPLVN